MSNEEINSEIEKIRIEGMSIDVSEIEDKELLAHLLENFENFKWFSRMYAKDYELKIVKKKWFT